MAARGRYLLLTSRCSSSPPSSTLLLRPESRFLAGWLCGEREDGTIDMDRLRSLLIDLKPTDPSAVAAAAAAAVENHRSASAPTAAASIAAESTSAAPLPVAAISTSIAPSSSPSSSSPLQSPPRLPQKRVLELGSACGALSIFLSLLGVAMTASDLDDPIVTANIEYNAQLNAVPPHLLRTMPHTWGQRLERVSDIMRSEGPYDVIVASDILNYEDQFDDLVNTLSVLMPRPTTTTTTATSANENDEATSASAATAASAPSSAASSPPSASATTAASSTASPSSSPSAPPGCIFRMVWKRRSKGRDQEKSFFDRLRANHFHVEALPAKVFEISRR